MELPKTVDIMGLIYRVEEVDIVNKFTPRNGEIDFQSQIIKIDKGLTEDRKAVVLIHEVLHGELEALGLSEISDNENMVQSLAIALYHTIKHLIISS
jgi:hypothetical protein